MANNPAVWGKPCFHEIDDLNGFRWIPHVPCAYQICLRKHNLPFNSFSAKHSGEMFSPLKSIRIICSAWKKCSHPDEVHIVFRAHILPVLIWAAVTNTITWVVCQQQKFISRSSGSQGSVLRFWWKPSSGLQTADLALYTQVAERELGSSLACSQKNNNAIHEGSSLMT